MKKFFIASLAIVVATFTQAVSVDWASGDLAQYVTSEIDDVTAYYYVIDKTAYDNAKDMSQGEIYNTYYGGSVTPEVVPWDADLGMANVTLDHPADTMTGNNVYAIAIYKFDTKSGGSYALASALEYDTSSPAEGEFKDPDELTNSGVAEKAYASNGNSWTAVPEPTTVALIALGLAAVGLKRKVA